MGIIDDLVQKGRLKNATKGKLPRSVYDTLERGMDLREMADYKENYSQKGAENLILAVKDAIVEIEKLI